PPCCSPAPCSARPLSRCSPRVCGPTDVSGLLGAAAAPTRREPRRAVGGRTRRRLLRQPVAMSAGVVLAVVLAIGAITPRIAPSPQTIDFADRWRDHAPILSGWHLLGTDNLG